MKGKKITIKLAIILTVLLTLSATGFGQKVRYNYLPGTDFSKYKTYRWVRLESAQYPAQLVDEQIMRAIDQQLSIKGLRRVESGDSDLIAVYQVAVSQEKQWNAYSTGGGYWGYGGWAGWGGGMTTTTVTTDTINIGTLNLDLYDVALKKQVWRGEATKTLNPPKDPAKRQKNLEKAMEKLLKNYPPPVK